MIIVISLNAFLSSKYLRMVCFEVFIALNYTDDVTTIVQKFSGSPPYVL